MNVYIQILIDSLEKKISIMNQIEVCNGAQYEISSHQPMDLDAFDQIVEQKDALLRELIKLDDGFTLTFERIKPELLEHKEQYKEEIGTLQRLIRKTIDLGVSIEAQEKRNKASMEAGLRMRRTEMKQMKRSSAVAANYYNNMNKMNHVDPQLLDHHQ